MLITTIINTALDLGDPGRSIVIRGFKASSYSETPSQPNFDEISVQGRSSPIQFYNNGSARTISFSMIFLRDMFMSSIDFSEMYTEQPTVNAIVRSSGRKSSGVIGIYTDDQGVSSLNRGKLSSLAQLELSSFYGTDELSDLGVIGSGSSALRRAKADATDQFRMFINKIKALNYPVYTNNGVISPKCFLMIGGDNSASPIHLEGYCKTSVEYDGLEANDSFIAATVRFEFIEVVHYSWSASQVMNGDPNKVVIHSHDEWWRR